MTLACLPVSHGKWLCVGAESGRGFTSAETPAILCPRVRICRGGGRMRRSRRRRSRRDTEILWGMTFPKGRRRRNQSDPEPDGVPYWPLVIPVIRQYIKEVLKRAAAARRIKALRRAAGVVRPSRYPPPVRIPVVPRPQPSRRLSKVPRISRLRRVGRRSRGAFFSSRDRLAGRFFR